MESHTNPAYLQESNLVTNSLLQGITGKTHKRKRESITRVTRLYTHDIQLLHDLYDDSIVFSTIENVIFDMAFSRNIIASCSEKEDTNASDEFNDILIRYYVPFLKLCYREKMVIGVVFYDMVLDPIYKRHMIPVLIPSQGSTIYYQIYNNGTKDYNIVCPFINQQQWLKRSKNTIRYIVFNDFTPTGKPESLTSKCIMILRLRARFLHASVNSDLKMALPEIIASPESTEPSINEVVMQSDIMNCAGDFDIYRENNATKLYNDLTIGNVFNYNMPASTDKLKSVQTASAFDAHMNERDNSNLPSVAVRAFGRNVRYQMMQSQSTRRDISALMEKFDCQVAAMVGWATSDFQINTSVRRIGTADQHKSIETCNHVISNVFNKILEDITVFHKNTTHLRNIKLILPSVHTSAEQILDLYTRGLIKPDAMPEILEEIFHLDKSIFLVKKQDEPNK